MEIRSTVYSGLEILYQDISKVYTTKSITGNCAENVKHPKGRARCHFMNERGKCHYKNQDGKISLKVYGIKSRHSMPREGVR